MHIIEGLVVARLYSLAVGHERLDDVNEVCVSERETCHDVCEGTELEELMVYGGLKAVGFRSL